MKILKRRVMMMTLQLFFQNWKRLTKKELRSRPGRNKNKKQPGAGGWLKPVILATQEAEIRKVQNQPGQIV
jgi:hypothetical protein